MNILLKFVCKEKIIVLYKGYINCEFSRSVKSNCAPLATTFSPDISRYLSVVISILLDLSMFLRLSINQITNASDGATKNDNTICTTQAGINRGASLPCHNCGEIIFAIQYQNITIAFLVILFVCPAQLVIDQLNINIHGIPKIGDAKHNIASNATLLPEGIVTIAIQAARDGRLQNTTEKAVKLGL